MDTTTHQWELIDNLVEILLFLSFLAHGRFDDNLWPLLCKTHFPGLWWYHFSWYSTSFKSLFQSFFGRPSFPPSYRWWCLFVSLDSLRFYLGNLIHPHYCLLPNPSKSTSRTEYLADYSPSLLKCPKAI